MARHSLNRTRHNGIVTKQAGAGAAGWEMADTAPVTVVADPAAARLDPTRRLITVAGGLGTPRYDSLPDGRTPVAAAGR